MTAQPLPILPGSWLGLLGGGQLGRMFCQAAHRLGYRVAVLEPDPDSPAGRIADRHLIANYAEPAALDELRRLCAAFTTEFENVPHAALDALALHGPVRPGPGAVAIAQNRIREKRFLKSAGVTIAPHAFLETPADLAGGQVLPLYPGILKSNYSGYDGRGQVRVESPGELVGAHIRLGCVPCVLEQRIAFERELSVIVVRTHDGATCVYPVSENIHRDGILHTSIAPARIAPAVAAEAQAIAQHIAAAMDYVGVLCVELFQLPDGKLAVNEIAPRPHNSGHFTIDACVTSQFEQQVRTLTGLPLGDTGLRSAAVMLNLLGDLWSQGEPDWSGLLAEPDVRLHLYGKDEPRAGRKMGHVTVVGATASAAFARAAAIGARLDGAPRRAAMQHA